ncbi:target of Sbf [Pichia californica]|uniref:glucan endo-1,3-beta-D-glucosidase n=1 Tax=Pichia californica TaxID=460514 RepID=A0A9P7BDX6_9ASCO|nr:target of Sbf [[Candida] californica]KAG0686495.1 target of Sbf [[Candida] californica]
MRFSTSLLYTIATTLVSTTSVNAGCSYISGNYYCSEVSAIQYEGIGFSGSYNDVTNMDETTCQCTSSESAFSGTMAPLDEELSVHFRGPLKLSQFGVYYLSSSLSKRDEESSSSIEEDCTTTHHIHHQHKRAAAIEYAYVTETVYEDANGNLVSSTETATSAYETPTGATGDETTLLTVTTSSSSDSTSSTSSTAAAAATTSSSSSSSGDWVRSAYYTPGTADGLVFLNSMGGTAGSGTWSSCFGNSLSYCASDGVSGAGSAQTLGDVTIASDVEFMIFSDTSCSDSSSSDCGYYRSDIPAYHGFNGATKIFVFEFLMPQASDSASTNYDMPAIWLLNAKIPRTLQYGDSSCSCWSTGCGEFDVFEILSSGSDKLISHLHDGQGSSTETVYGGGGSSDYFSRPYSSTMKAAVIFQNGEISIVVLDDDASFDSTLSSSTVSDWLSTSGSTVSI